MADALTNFVNTLTTHNGKKYQLSLNLTERPRRKEPSKAKIAEYWGRDIECFVCGTDTLLERCHLFPRYAGGLDGPQNIWILCSACHKYQIDFNSVDGALRWASCMSYNDIDRYLNQSRAAMKFAQEIGWIDEECNAIEGSPVEGMELTPMVQKIANAFFDTPEPMEPDRITALRIYPGLSDILK